MGSRSSRASQRGRRRGRQLRPVLFGLEERVVPALTFPGLAGVAFDSSGDLFVSYNSTGYATGQQQSVAEMAPNGSLLNSSVFGTTGSAALPGCLAMVGPTASLPGLSGSSTPFLELQPNGELFKFNPGSGSSAQYDNLASRTLNATHVYNLQSGSTVDLTSKISLVGATFGDFGIYQNTLVVSAESNHWDFVVRVSYRASASAATVTVLVASPASDGRAATPGGVAVDSQGLVLTTLPYLPTGSSTAMHVPVGFNLAFDTGSSPAPYAPQLGLTTVSNLDSGGITVDSQDNFILAARDSSLYGGGPGIVHINSALTAFLADPTTDPAAIPIGITYQNVGGTNYLAYIDANSETYTEGTEIPLFSGQVTPAQLRKAYGVDQISFLGPAGTSIAGTGAGQTIAIVEMGVDPTLQADLQAFDRYFGIPDPPSYTTVNQNGVTTQNPGIISEASLDVQWAHAVAPGASIVVYNSAYDPNDPTGSFQNLITAMHQASLLPGVSVVSLSYGMTEAGVAASGLNQQTLDTNFTTQGVTFLAASGDSGIYGMGGNTVGTNYPASSPNLVAVGGTAITIDAAGNYPGTGSTGEVAWGFGTSSGTSGGAGGGLSTLETKPSYQTGIVSTSIDPTGARAVPDVAIDSGSAQQYDVFTSTLGASSTSASAVGWLGDAGTSAAAPIWAGLIAIANQGRALAGATPLTGTTQTLPALYALPATAYHDIVNGNNGYPAGAGFDLTSGRGSPIANLLVPDLAGYQVASQLTMTTQPPASLLVGSPFGLTVQVTDSLGTLIQGGTVTVALANHPDGAVLGGTLTVPVVNGLATFSGLTLSQPGSGYTLKLTEGVATVKPITTTPLTVTAGDNATRVTASAWPLAPVFGNLLTVTATVSEVRPGTGAPTGTITLQQGTTILGTAPLAGGVATFNFTPATAGAQTITILYGGDAADQPSSTTLPLTVSKATATQTLTHLNLFYTSAAQAAVVTTTPADLPGVSMVYTQNGVPVAQPIQAGTYTVTATLDNPNDPAATVSDTLVIGQATPLIAWTVPAALAVGTPLSAAQLDAKALFDGVAVPGVFTYTPVAGTVLPAGNGQLLMLSFVPADRLNFKAVAASVPMDVISYAHVISEKAIRKNGKTTGFTLGFDVLLSAAAATNPAHYQLSLVKLVKAGTKTTRVLVPITGFKVIHNPSTHAVTLKLTSPQKFLSGGQLTVLASVATGSGSVLSGTTVFKIAAGGVKIGP